MEEYWQTGQEDGECCTRSLDKERERTLEFGDGLQSVIICPTFFVSLALKLTALTCVLRVSFNTIFLYSKYQVDPVISIFYILFKIRNTIPADPSSSSRVATLRMYAPVFPWEEGLLCSEPKCYKKNNIPVIPFKCACSSVLTTGYCRQ